MPLVHINLGRNSWARGIIAIGSIATGIQQVVHIRAGCARLPFLHCLPGDPQEICQLLLGQPRLPAKFK